MVGDKEGGTEMAPPRVTC